MRLSPPYVVLGIEMGSSLCKAYLTNYTIIGPKMSSVLFTGPSIPETHISFPQDMTLLLASASSSNVGQLSYYPKHMNAKYFYSLLTDLIFP